MEFKQKLIEGRLLRRYKRFIADIELPDGRVVQAHCPNSGSMKTCLGERWPVRLSQSNNPKRKLRYTWEMVHNGICWIGINTHLANAIVAEAIGLGRIPELAGYGQLRREVRYGRNSRVDILLSQKEHHCYVEVKNVTLVEEDGYYKFPDAVTSRGLKHLGELMDMVRLGQRAVMLFLIQRSDGRSFRPAEEIDPQYAQQLRRAARAGVEILPYLAEVSPQKIEITSKITYEPEA